MLWGTVTIAGMALREEVSVDQNGDTVGITGQESYPPRTLAHVEATHHNINGLAGSTVPITFTEKPGMDGFYRVTDARSVLRRIRDAGGPVQMADWSLSLERVGNQRDVEVESRVPTIPRLDEIAGTQTPSYWHAPAVGFTSYWTGSTVPAGSTPRVSSDGTVTVHTGIPTSVAPRWTVPVDDYLAGSSRILLDGLRRLGTHTPAHLSWRMHNGIVHVAGEPSGRFSVASWDGNDWRSIKLYAPAVSGVSLTTTPEVSILRNDPEECAIRLSYPEAVGKTTVDLSVRRGSRFASGVIKRHGAATLGVRRAAAEAAAVVTGGLRATAVDADGNRFVMLSSRLLGTVDTATAYISKASVTAFDFALGHEVAVGPITDEVQSVTFGGTPTGGTFTLTFGGQTTSALAWNATAAAVDTALEALSTIGAGNVSVTGGPGPAAYTVTFTAALAASNVTEMTANGAALTGPPKITTGTTTPGAPGTNEVQTVSFGGTVTGGTYTLTFNGQTTGALQWNATAATVQTALTGLSTVGAGNLAVTGGPGPATLTLTFQGALRSTNVAQVTGTSSLTGTAPTLTTATTTEGVPGTSEVQSITFDPSVNGGTYTLTFSGQTTAAIAYNATTAAVTSALEALSNIAVGEVTVTGGPGPTAYAVAFNGGTLRDTDVAQMTANGTSLTYGAQPTISVTTTTQGVPVQSGDGHADLLAQYLGSSGERARIVRR